MTDGEYEVEWSQLQERLLGAHKKIAELSNAIAGAAWGKDSVLQEENLRALQYWLGVAERARENMVALHKAYNAESKEA
jgi:hypothetical protein